MEFISLNNKAMGNIPLKFLPSQLTGLKLWTRFNSGITETGAGVSQWDDQSGNGNHLKQGTDTNRPSKESDGSVLFDGSDNFLLADAFTLNQPTTIYLLLSQKTWAGNDYFCDGNINNRGVIRQAGTSPGLRAYAGTNSAENSNLALDTYGVICSVFNGAASVFQINNTTALTGDYGSSNMAGFTLGTIGDGSGNWANIQVKEAAVYNTAHDAATRAKVIKYLADVGDLSI